VAAIMPMAPRIVLIFMNISPHPEMGWWSALRHRHDIVPERRDGRRPTKTGRFKHLS
jgi:hypothetical protein